MKRPRILFAQDAGPGGGVAGQYGPEKFMLFFQHGPVQHGPGEEENGPAEG